MVNRWCSASDRIRVPARPAQHVHRRVFQTCDAGRARVYLPSEAGTPDTTIERDDADHAGARPYLRRRPSGSVLLFLGLHTQKQSLLSCQVAATGELAWTTARFSDSQTPLRRFNAQRDAGKMPTLPCSALAR